MKVASAAILSLLIAQTAFAVAQGAPQAAPLAPGKPAGVRQAQDTDPRTPLLVMGAAAVGIGIALAVAGDGDTPINPPVTSTTSTTP